MFGYFRSVNKVYPNFKRSQRIFYDLKGDQQKINNESFVDSLLSKPYYI